MIVYQVKREPVDLTLTQDEWAVLAEAVYGDTSADTICIDKFDLPDIKEAFSYKQELYEEIEKLVQDNNGYVEIADES